MYYFLLSVLNYTCYENLSEVEMCPSVLIDICVGGFYYNK
jgi:hypothetical protein